MSTTRSPQQTGTDTRTGEPIAAEQAPTRGVQTPEAPPTTADRTVAAPATAPATTTDRTVAAPATAPAATGPAVAAAPGYMPRSRGALSGLVVFVLGIWAAIIPFVGPYFHYAFINQKGFSFPTYGRLWLEILPGALAALAGLEMMGSVRRPGAAFASICAAIAGAWLVVGPTVSMLWNHGVPQTGHPLGGTFMRTIEQLGYFYVPGVIIVLFAGMALARVATRSARDAAVDRRAAAV